MYLVFCWSFLVLSSGVVPSANALLLENPQALGNDAGKIKESTPKTVEHVEKFAAHRPRATEPVWPCPVPEFIVPCTCESRDENYEVNIDCSAVNSEEEIRNAFASVFPFDDVMYFTINNDDMVNDVTNLTRGIFGTKSFGSVQIKGTTLSIVDDNVFDYSHGTLFSLDMSKNKLQTFPFQTLYLYGSLISLNLNYNSLIEIPELYSSSLRIFNANSNANLKIQETTDTFVNVPELRQLYLENISLNALVPDLFSSLEYISDIYLSDNSLVELDENTFNNPNPSVQTLYLANNMISTVREGAIKGLSPDGVLNLSGNQITILDQGIWESIFEQVLEGGAIILDENPLTCGCDFKWIVNNDNYWNLISDDSRCYAGALVSDIDKDFIIQNC